MSLAIIQFRSMKQKSSNKKIIKRAVTHRGSSSRALLLHFRRRLCKNFVLWARFLPPLSAECAERELWTRDAAEAKKSTSHKSASMDESFDSLFGFSCRHDTNNRSESEKRAMKNGEGRIQMKQVLEFVHRLSSLSGIVATFFLLFSITCKEIFLNSFTAASIGAISRTQRSSRQNTWSDGYLAHTKIIVGLKMRNLHQNDDVGQQFFFNRRLLRLTLTVQRRKYFIHSVSKRRER